VVAAKQICTLDHFGKGRLELGIGIGAYREEFKALQPDAKIDRGEIVDEGLQALNLLFKDRVASFDGRYYKFKDVELFPKPYQKKLPIYVSGNHVNNIERAVKWADGWLPAGMHVDRIRSGVKALREQADKAGRDWRTIEVCPQFVVHVGKTHEQAIESFRKSQMNKHLVSLSKSTLKGQGTATHEEINLIGTPAEVTEKALAFKDAGVTHLLGLYFAANSVQELLDQMQVFAEEVMPKVTRP
jgi:alkanesulfonate monooxygenase SsuD/methylene tetrahydromethanopterin reductase-like flavin-dependent oxidoreductase (luciferase family)